MSPIRTTRDGRRRGTSPQGPPTALLPPAFDQLGRMAAGIIHEIKNPLGTALGNTRILAQYLSDLRRLLALYEKAAELPAELRATAKRLEEEIDYAYLAGDIDAVVSAVRDGIERSLRIVATLRQFMQDPGSLAVVSAEEFCEAARRQVEAERGLSISASYRCGVKVLCAPAAMEIVVGNLLRNAADAVDGAGWVGLSTAQRGASCEIAVEDAGPGIPPEIRPRLFEPFVTTKPPEKGLGLGLALCKNIVSRHVGVLRCEERDGGGTRMIVELAIAPAESAAPGG